MKTPKYKIGDIVLVNRKEYQQITTVQYINIYPNDIYYSCVGVGMLLKNEDIVGKTDSEGNIIF